MCRRPASALAALVAAVLIAGGCGSTASHPRASATADAAPAPHTAPSSANARLQWRGVADGPPPAHGEGHVAFAPTDP